jgi:hypothetical protein
MLLVLFLSLAVSIAASRDQQVSVSPYWQA